MRLTRNSSMLALLALVVCGCSSDGLLKPRGRIIKNGAPFQLGEAEGMRIIFAPVEAGKETYESYVAVFKNDGTFQVTGKDGKGMPPGKYRISLEHLKKKADLLKGAFSGKKSPFVREVTNGSEEIVLDLDHPQL